jgi:hypothetical protein
VITLSDCIETISVTAKSQGYLRSHAVQIRGRSLTSPLVASTRGVARKAPLVSLQNPSPGVIYALGGAFTPAQLRDAVLAAQTIQHDADFPLSRILLARRSQSTIINRGFKAFFS